MIQAQRHFPGVEEQLEKSSLPAPMKGINALDSLMRSAPGESIYAYNLVPGQYGLVVRNGYREWVTNVVGTGGVKTIVPVKGFLSTQDRLFGISADGIYEISASTSAPTKRLDYATKTTEAGWASWCSFTTVAGQFIPICDELNGYSYYDPVADTFTTPTFGGGAGQISGIDPAKLAFVISHKGRLWFIERDSSRAWYLPVGLLTGAATLFDFGNKFVFGGSLAGLYPFTIDGGLGAEDYLVAVSTSGDVVVYLGTDPSVAANWDQKGIWYIGDIPKGRRLADVYGGDLLLLSAYGVIPLSRVMAGADLSNEDAYLSRNISNFINTDMQSFRAQRGWEIKSYPPGNLLLVATPKQIGLSYKQYAQNTFTKGWGIYRDLIYQTAEIWNGKLYVGTSDGRILLHEGNVDGTTLAGTGSVEINWSLLTMYAGDYANKMPSFVRPYFMSSQRPSTQIKILFDFDINEPPGNVAYSGSSGSVWDVGLWDSAIWGGGLNPFQGVAGVGGIGHYMAIAMKGSSISDTRFIGFDACYQKAQQNGFM